MVRVTKTIVISLETAQAIEKAILSGEKVNISDICDKAIQTYLLLDSPKTEIQVKNLDDIRKKREQINKKHAKNILELKILKQKEDKIIKERKEKRKNTSVVYEGKLGVLK